WLLRKASPQRFLHIESINSFMLTINILRLRRPSCFPWPSAYLAKPSSIKSARPCVSDVGLLRFSFCCCRGTCSRSGDTLICGITCHPLPGFFRKFSEFIRSLRQALFPLRIGGLARC